MRSLVSSGFWTSYWLVDPLDGTREFVKRNGEFSVNIALIHMGAPVLGVVQAPRKKAKARSCASNTISCVSRG